MNRLKKCLVGLLAFSMILSGCAKTDTRKDDHHLTVFLWESRLVKNLAPYIRSQYPDMDIEFISGNNNTDLYEYYQEHGELPDIIRMLCSITIIRINLLTGFLYVGFHKQ